MLVTSPVTIPTPHFITKYLTTHKGPVLAAKFSPNGQLVATGSEDTAVKLLSVELMNMFSENRVTDDIEVPSKPVVKTFYDHENSVNDLDFHPFSPHLISASKDCTIKFHEYEKSNSRKAFRFLQDTHPVNSVNFHPSGDFLLAGTEHHMIRLYDITTFNCYTAPVPDDNHTAAVNSVRYSSESNVFASGSLDGTVKIWVSS